MLLLLILVVPPCGAVIVSGSSGVDCGSSVGDIVVDCGCVVIVVCFCCATISLSSLPSFPSPPAPYCPYFAPKAEKSRAKTFYRLQHSI